MINYTDISLSAANEELIEHFRARWTDKSFWEVSEVVFEDFARQSIAEYLNSKLPEIIARAFTANPAYRIGEAMKE